MIRPGTAHSYRGRRLEAAGAAAASTGASLATAGISAGVQLAADAASMWMNSIQRSHDAMTATTLIVNGLEQQLKNLDAAYFAERAPTCADQRAALNAYDEAWLWLQSPAACGNPNFGAPGNACIQDRSIGGRWPWQVYYRDPIAQDSRVGPCDTGQEVILPSLQTGTYQATDITSSGGSATTGTPATSSAPPAAAPFVSGISNQTLLIVAAALVAGLALSEGNK